MENFSDEIGIYCQEWQSTYCTMGASVRFRMTSEMITSIDFLSCNAREKKIGTCQSSREHAIKDKEIL